MSERKGDEVVRLRNLPPVEPVDWPERLSMTLARYLNRCPRAAYLYVATGAGAPTLEMDRGTLAHEALARLMAELIQHGEKHAGGGDEELSSFTAEIVRTAAQERPDLWLSHEQKDIARLCAFHAAIGLDVNPEHVVGIERKFVLELESGWTVSGIVDLAAFPEGDEGLVDDYKTQLHVPPYDEWDWYQQKLYAAMLVFGKPVERVTCAECQGRGEIDSGAGDVNPPAAPEVLLGKCEDCKGRGWVEEIAEQSIGGHLSAVTGREIYPRHDPRKRQDGKMAHLWRRWTRLELQELVIDMNDAAARLTEMLETWKFPARYGTKACNECPAETLCPIPRGYRRFAGHITDELEATEAWAWVQRMKGLVSVTEKEVKQFAANNAVAIEVGDEVWEYTLSESTSLKKRSGRADWDGFAAALEGAFDRGDDFDLKDWLKTSNTSTFKKQKAKPIQEEKPPAKAKRQESEEDVGRRLDAEFGPDAPY